MTVLTALKWVTKMGWRCPEVPVSPREKGVPSFSAFFRYAEKVEDQRVDTFLVLYLPYLRIS